MPSVIDIDDLGGYRGARDSASAHQLKVSSQRSGQKDYQISKRLTQ